jgi:hypothetical protein
VDRGSAPPDEQLKGSIDIEVDAVAGERLAKAATTENFAVDQHTVAVENDQVDLGHYSVPKPLHSRRYTHLLSNSPAFRDRRITTAVQAAGHFRS